MAKGRRVELPAEIVLLRIHRETRRPSNRTEISRTSTTREILHRRHPESEDQREQATNRMAIKMQMLGQTVAPIMVNHGDLIEVIEIGTTRCLIMRGGMTLRNPQIYREVMVSIQLSEHSV